MITEWKTIDSALRDGTRIYGIDADGWTFITYWEPWFSGPAGNWVCEGRIETEYEISRLAYWNPIRWTELPAPPEAECIGLAGCNHSASHVLSQLTIATVGHDAPGLEQEQEDIPVPPIEPVVEPPVYVPPVTEACEPGTHGFRLWDCVDGHRVYW